MTFTDFENIFKKTVVTNQEDFDLKPSFVIFKRNIEHSDQYFIIGNGFFINAEGCFVTAGHVFKKEGDFFIGFPEENKNIKLFPVIWKAKLYRSPYDYNEYQNRVKREASKYQKGQEYKDIGVGQVDINNTPFFVFMDKRPRKGDVLNVNGFRRKIGQPEAGISLVNNRISCEYYFEDRFEYICNKRIVLVRYPCKNDKIFIGDKNNYYNNCMILDGTNKRGISGSPVLNKYGAIIGMVIGGDTPENKTFIILSKYINKTSKRLFSSKF